MATGVADMSALTAEPGVKLHELEPGFFATLEDYADRCAAHRYAVPIHVTSANRPGDTKAHGFSRAVDFRGRITGWDTPAKRKKLDIFLAAMWVTVCRDHGYGPEEWGFGTYTDDSHYHIDVRPHVGPDLYAAVWTER